MKKEHIRIALHGAGLMDLTKYPPAMLEEFYKAMRNRQYGSEALLNAFGWFEYGWRAHEFTAQSNMDSQRDENKRQ